MKSIFPIALALTALVLGACSQNGGGGTACSAPQLQNPFSMGGKVQINSLSKFSPSASNLTLNLSANPTVATDPAVPAGTKLVEVVKDSCLPGAAPTQSGVHSVSWVAPKDMRLSQVRAQAEADPCIVGISDNVVAGISGMYSDPLVAQQAQLSAIDESDGNNIYLDPAKGITKDVVIAIIDTGVDITHEDLKDNLWVNTKEIPGNGIDDDHNGYIDDVNGYNFASNIPSPMPEGNWSGNDHGTHVAGLAAARGGNGVGGAGVMGQHIKIMALNVFGQSSGADTSNIDNAIRYAADNGADVINMSLGGSGQATSTQDAVTYALSKGVTVVVAAGNSGYNLDTGAFETPASFSAMYPGVIAVGAVDDVNYSMPSWSDYGTNTVKIGAPGSDSGSTGLLSTLPGNQYGRMQGTSMASPVAAGGASLAVGLIRSRGRKPTPALVESMMLSSGQVVQGLTSLVKDGKVLNVGNMAKLIDAQFPYGAVGPGDTAAGSCL